MSNVVDLFAHLQEKKAFEVNADISEHIQGFYNSIMETGFVSPTYGDALVTLVHGWMAFRDFEPFKYDYFWRNGYLPVFDFAGNEATGAIDWAKVTLYPTRTKNSATSEIDMQWLDSQLTFKFIPRTDGPRFAQLGSREPAMLFNSWFKAMAVQKELTPEQYITPLMVTTVFILKEFQKNSYKLDAADQEGNVLKLTLLADKVMVEIDINFEHYMKTADYFQEALKELGVLQETPTGDSNDQKG